LIEINGSSNAFDSVPNVAMEMAMPIWLAFLCVKQLIVNMGIHILRGLTITMLTMLTLVVSNGVAFAGPFEDAEAAYNRSDYATALRLMMPLAEQGNAHAQSYTGFMYANGQGVRRNHKEAVKWYRLAAEQGDVQGESNLGRVYANGLGVPKDYDEAAKWYRLAAAQGNATAQNALGLMYAHGQSVPKDYVLSLMWLTIGKKNSNLAANIMLQVVTLKMSHEQIELAKKMAQLCEESNYKQCEKPKGDQFSILATSVPMRIEGGIYVIPVLINDAITLNFIIDRGAADVRIPADVVMTLMRTGTLKNSDFLGEKAYVLADGSEVPSRTFRIRSLTVGSKVLENVIGSIASVRGGGLLGRSFLRRFKSWSVDNTKHVLLLSDWSSDLHGVPKMSPP
jgi:predicted aspartyl protease